MIRLTLLKKEVVKFLKRIETFIFIVALIIFTIIIWDFPKDQQNIVFLLSINTSLWAALFFYLIFNLYSHVENQYENLMMFKEVMNRKVGSFEKTFQDFIDEAKSYDPNFDFSKSKTFFNYVNVLPKDHITKSNGLRMIKQSCIENGRLKSIYFNIQDACIYKFDQLIKQFSEIERLALSLQLRHIDPNLYEKIYNLIDTKPTSRYVLNNNPMNNPHSALAGDLDILTSKLRILIKYLNENFKLGISMRDDIR